MKKILFSLFIAGGFVNLNAQQKNEAPAPKDWFHQSIDEGVYGVNTQKAYEFLKTTGRKPEPIIVGVLDSGVDLEHEDLKDIRWTNTEEIVNNGKDDDRNGHIDDMHGWNFLGNPDGENIGGANLEITRLYKKYRNKFGGIKDRKIKRNIKKYPKQYTIYKKAKEEIADEIEKAKEKIGQMKTNKEFIVSYKEKITPIFEQIKKSLGSTITPDKLSSFAQNNNKEQIQEIYPMLGILIKMIETSSDKKIDIKKAKNKVQQALAKKISGANDYIEYFESKVKYHYNVDFDANKIVRDNQKRLRQYKYGNNNAEGPDAIHGTHVSGLIAAVRNNGIGMNGISNAARIMSVRVVPDGDERDKDVANGIIYAVKKGAKILNMSFGKSYSPNKSAVDKAVRYAAKKGVLIVHAAGNDGKDLDDPIKNPNFPVNVTKNDTIARNWITVGASTYHKEHLAAQFSNYGSKSVDLFSPGTEIYSTIPDNKYKKLQGTSMASPVVAGVAALVWSYYPELSMQELRHVLLKSVNVYEGMVPTPNEDKEESKIDQPFNKLSKTGGVIDAYLAVKNADVLVKSKQ